MPHSTQRRIISVSEDEMALNAYIAALAKTLRRIIAPLHDAGCAVDVKRLERLWRQEGREVRPNNRCATNFG